MFKANKIRKKGCGQHTGDDCDEEDNLNMSHYFRAPYKAETLGYKPSTS